MKAGTDFSTNLPDGEQPQLHTTPRIVPHPLHRLRGSKCLVPECKILTKFWEVWKEIWRNDKRPRLYQGTKLPIFCSEGQKKIHKFAVAVDIVWRKVRRVLAIVEGKRWGRTRLRAGSGVQGWEEWGIYSVRRFYAVWVSTKTARLDFTQAWTEGWFPAQAWITGDSSNRFLSSLF